jgi:hypothetical protein
MKVKTLIVLVSVLLCTHFGHAQDVSIQDTCMIVYGTGTIDADPENVTLNFTFISEVETDPPPVPGGILDLFEGLWLDLDMMDTLTFRNYWLWPYTVRHTKKVKHKEDSIKVDFALKLNDLTALTNAISLLSISPYWINKISYSCDETKTRLEAYKMAVDNAIEKADYAASQFNFVKGPIFLIEEIAPSSVEQVEPGVCLRVTSTVKVVFRIWN